MKVRVVVEYWEKRSMDYWALEEEIYLDPGIHDLDNYVIEVYPDGVDLIENRNPLGDYRFNEY